MQPVIQEHPTGCGIATVAALAGSSYQQTGQVANELGICAEDPALWTDTTSVRRLLNHYGILAAPTETPFSGWDDLPDLALLAIKWHLEQEIPCWHWTVFCREAAGSVVLDPKAALKRHRRTDFGRIKPKWFIAIKCSPADCSST